MLLADAQHVRQALALEVQMRMPIHCGVRRAVMVEQSLVVRDLSGAKIIWVEVLEEVLDGTALSILEARLGQT
ncbi:MAG: hypothetical protein SCG73_02460 [Nitrospiraceae bacterium]|nr:hypothetical protein [Nitrospiraceae bacterium]